MPFILLGIAGLRSRSLEQVAQQCITVLVELAC